MNGMQRSSRPAAFGGVLAAALLSVAAGSARAPRRPAARRLRTRSSRGCPTPRSIATGGMSDLDGKSLRASIGQGDDDPVLTINDRGFLKFSESDSPTVTLRANGDPAKAIELTGWVSSDVGGSRMFGVYLRPKRGGYSGARPACEILEKGETLADQMLERRPARPSSMPASGLLRAFGPGISATGRKVTVGKVPSGPALIGVTIRSCWSSTTSPGRCIGAAFPTGRR